MASRKGNKEQMNRRDFIKTVGTIGAAGVGASLLGDWAHAAKRDYILIGHPAPTTWESVK